MEILPFISFFTGVISILSPCILPVIPIFVAFSLKSRSKTEIFSFVLGFSTIFLAIIALTGFFTAVVYQYIFYARIVSAVLLLIIGIMMLADYTMGFKAFSSKNSEGIVGSFAFGFLTSVAWAPCYSAYLISLIGLLVSSNSSFDAVFNLVLYCLGFAFTLFVLSYLISRVNLEKLISKTKYIPKIFGILIIIGAVYLFISLF